MKGKTTVCSKRSPDTDQKSSSLKKKKVRRWKHEVVIRKKEVVAGEKRSHSK